MADKRDDEAGRAWPANEPDIPAEVYPNRRRAARPLNRPPDAGNRSADHRPAPPTLVAPDAAQIGDLVHGLALVNWPGEPATWPRPGDRRTYGPGLFECVTLPDQDRVFWRRVG